VTVEDHDTPPSQWCDWWEIAPVELNADIAYGWPGEGFTAHPDDPNPWFWHWCPAMKATDRDGRWMAQSTRDHQLVSREPLDMTPSLLWPCCGTHGFVREGVWIPA
jgi:hypothetical protein